MHLLCPARCLRLIAGELFATDRRQTMLHLAAVRGASAAVIALLLARHPAAARAPTLRGVLPLHLAARGAAGGAESARVVALLLGAFPEATSLLLCLLLATCD